jgi:hypothetical protein
MIIWAPQEYSGAEWEIHDSRQNAEEFWDEPNEENKRGCNTKSR